MTAASDPIEWGAPIPVDGKRPEWLAPGEGSGGKIEYRGLWCHQSGTYDQWCWGGVTAIRLPADHPRYSRPEPQPADTVMVGRMEALVRRMAGNSSMGEPYEEDRAITYNSEHYYEARAIVALLPDPINPDLIEAREVACQNIPSWTDGHKRECRAGRYDSNLFVVHALAGIRRGRALAAAEVGK